MSLRSLAAAAFCAAAPLSSFATFQLVPAQPTEFEPLNIRSMLGACEYDPATVSVTMAGNVVRVVYRGPEICLSAPPPPTLVDLRLGTLPRGSYAVEVYKNGGAPDGNFSERIAFSVASRVTLPVVPPIPQPNTDYSGQWFTPTEAGWGLSIEQSHTNTLFGAWYVFSDEGTPMWLTLQSGRWESPTRWSGKLYGTMGPDTYFDGPFDRSQVVTAEIGTATLDFTQYGAGDGGKARLEYTLGPVSGAKTIQRLRF